MSGVSDDDRLGVLDACFRCVARWGINKTTMDDVAREAGTSRATLYRWFPGGREEILTATIALELDRFFDRLTSRLAHHDDVTDELIELVVATHDETVNHQVLQALLATEPDSLLARLAGDDDPVLSRLREVMQPLMIRAGALDATEAADYVGRLVLSYVTDPGDLDMADHTAVGRMVRTHLLGWRTT
ncbi:MAG TPA: TetR/AcrR family transcriptional regulator [Acidimicrobiales bacterium]|jgi:AcrR family transcriptional regulator